MNLAVLYKIAILNIVHKALILESASFSQYSSLDFHHCRDFLKRCFSLQLL